MAVMCVVAHHSEVQAYHGPKTAHPEAPRAYFTAADLERVHQEIERCISWNLCKQDTAKYLLERWALPSFLVNIVWQRLEEQNPEFFQEYYLKLSLLAMDSLSL